MKKHLKPLTVALLAIPAVLTSFSNKAITISDTRTTETGIDKQFLYISSQPNLGAPRAMLHADSIYSSLDYKDALFQALPNNFEDKIVSFHLPKGYMAVFAENSDGTGESACFVASTSDINANLPARLKNNVSYVRYIAINNPEKKGTDAIKPEAVKAVGVQWYYCWGPEKPSYNGQQFVPMTWGKGSANEEIVKYLIHRKDVDHLLSFNEPDNKGQANIQNFDTAVARYKLMLKSGLRMGSPATTQGHAFGDGKWQTQFMVKATQEKARVDYIALHWYDWGNQNNDKETDVLTAEAVFKRFVRYIEKVHETYPDKPLWITEFNANVNRTSEAVHERFMEMATDWLNYQDYVERYAYFFEKNHPEVNADNTLTDIGKLWKSIKSTKAFTKNITVDAVLFKL